jgi:putative acetyltransferase
MIRKHEEKDLEDILNVWHTSSSMAHPFLKKSFVEKVKKDMRKMYIPNSETWVYLDDGVVIGFIGMQGNEIGGLFVLPSHHSKGVGTKLVDFMKTLHRELEVEVFVENSIGRSFYDKYGFQVISKDTHKESGHEVLRMQYVLP